MTGTPGAFLRLALLTVAAVLVQVSLISQLTVLGAAADIIPLVVAAIALYTGCIPGAVMGFFIGLALDLAVGDRVGTASLVLVPAGFAVGRYQEVREPNPALISVRVGAAVTLFYLAALSAVNFMVQPGISISPLTIRDMVVTVVCNIVLAGPVFWAVHSFLRPVLAFDPFKDHRRWRGRGRSRGLRLRGIGA